MKDHGRQVNGALEGRAKRKGRYSDGDGLFLRVMEPGKKAYWVYRYTLGGRERETSVGSYPGMSLADARIRHADLRAAVLQGTDPMGDRRKSPDGNAPVTPSGAQSFGEVADAYLERQERPNWAGTRSIAANGAPRSQACPHAPARQTTCAPTRLLGRTG